MPVDLSPQDPIAEETAPAPLRRVGGAVLPATDYSTDDGLGLGLYGALYLRPPDASTDDTSARIEAQVYRSTRGATNHFLRFDLPRLGPRDLRWDLYAAVESWSNGQYFGEGAWEPLTGADPTFGLDSVRVTTHLRVPLGGRLQAFAGGSGRDATVEAPAGGLLALEHPVGVEGGFFAQANAGLLVDTRDQEPTPRKGVFSEISIRGGWWSGTGGPFTGFTAVDRRWVPLGKGRAVLANQAVLDTWTGTMPFFEEPNLGSSREITVGGGGTLRGLPSGRYRGNHALLTDTEVRWNFWSPSPWGNRLDLFWVPFVDLGRIWSWGQDLQGTDGIHATGGLGFRFAWNRDFVVRADYGVGREETGAGYEGSAWSTGLYLTTDHPF